jgi:N-acetylated-alpha-linked acidic dipeptidase
MVTFTRIQKSLSHISIVEDKVQPIWNALAVIPGHIKDEVVVLGNHRDGEFCVRFCYDI